MAPVLDGLESGLLRFLTVFLLQWFLFEALVGLMMHQALRALVLVLWFGNQRRAREGRELEEEEEELLGLLPA